MRSKDPRMNEVVREIALDLAEGRYEHDFIEHVPGILNVLPDRLSRVMQPGASSEVPPELADARRATPESRRSSWWATALDPEAQGSGRRPEIH